MIKDLHIVALNIPYPPDYGGVIDIFYKIKALHRMGIQIHLHCFKYNRDETPELLKYCKEVHYYPRKSWLSAFGTAPYIVKSRKNRALLKRLCEDDYPILLEGLHDCGFLNHPLLEKRCKVVRPCNVEYQYYRGLAKDEKHLLRKVFFGIESLRLKRYDAVLKKATAIAPISMTDFEHYQKKYPQLKMQCIFCFHSNEEYQIEEQMFRPVAEEKYLLFHGDLSVSSNAKVAEFCIQATQNLPYPLILAGRNPSPNLFSLAQKHKHVRILANPSHEEMDQLVKNAQVLLMFSFNASGIKLKLLQSLYQGRFVIANRPMLWGSGLEQCCIEANSIEEIKKAIQYCMTHDFSLQVAQTREAVLNLHFSNRKNAIALLELF